MILFELKQSAFCCSHFIFYLYRAEKNNRAGVQRVKQCKIDLPRKYEARFQP